jgi:hypothetical protein
MMQMEQPLAEYRQPYWERDLSSFATLLATSSLRSHAEQWALITLAVEVSSAAMVTNERIADLTERLLDKGIDPTHWLALTDQAAGAPPAASVSSASPVGPAAASNRPGQAEVTGVRLPSGTSHYLGDPGKTLCGQVYPHDYADATWIRDSTFTPTCRRCQALFRPTFS